MRILFLHGMESQPGGDKPKFLEGLGHEVDNPALPKDSFEESVRIAQVCMDEGQPDVIVGSSRGAAVAMALNTRGIKLILIAPAYKSFGVTPKLDEAIILHSLLDDIIPVEDSIFLVDNFNVNLHLCGAGHRMSDPDALRVLGEVL